MRVTLRGTRSNRDGIGALVRAKVGQTWQTRMVRTGSSYLSQSELPVTFGLGAADAIGELHGGLAERCEGSGLVGPRRSCVRDHRRARDYVGYGAGAIVATLYAAFRPASLR